MFRAGRRRMSDDASPQGGKAGRSEELRQRVAELQQQLETERSLRKQQHGEKVREQRAVREECQATAREEVEKMKLKLQREKMAEIQLLEKNMTKDFKAQMRETMRKHEDECQTLQKNWKQERQEMKENLQRELMQEFERDIAAKYDVEKRKLTQQLFEVDTERKEVEARLANTTAADKTKMERIREMEHDHRHEIEKLQRAARMGSRHQTEELDEMKRRGLAREKEMVAVSERLSRVEADKEHLEEELMRMRRAEAWLRADPRASSPTSPPGTPGNMTPTKQSYTKRERDMVIKNSELTFMVKRLEEAKNAADEQAAKLRVELAKARDALKPHEDHIAKQSQRINDLNATLRSTERRFKLTTEENLKLKSSKQHLEEEYSRQRRTLKQQLSRGSEYRAERDKMSGRNAILENTTKRLEQQLHSSQEEVTKLKGWLGASLALPMSPSPTPFSPLSPVPPDEDVFSEASVQDHIEQLEFDREESKAKYEELLAEYKRTRENYKVLREKYDQVKTRARDQLTSLRQTQSSFELLKKEKVELEREVTLLCSSGGRDSPYDSDRQRALLEEKEERLKEAESRILELEGFVIEQDEVSKSLEASLMEERETLMEENQDLQDKLELSMAGSTTAGSSIDLSRLDAEFQASAGRSSDPNLEERNSELTALLDSATAKAAVLQAEVVQLHERMAAADEEGAAVRRALDSARDEVDRAPDQNEVQALRDANARLSGRVRELQVEGEEGHGEVSVRLHRAWGVASQLQDQIEEGTGHSNLSRELSRQLVELLAEGGHGSEESGRGSEGGGCGTEVGGRGTHQNGHEATETSHNANQSGRGMGKSGRGTDEPDGDDQPDGPAVDALVSVTQLQNMMRENIRLKEEVGRRELALAESSVRVTKLQLLVQELEARLDGTGAFGASPEEVDHKDVEIAQLTADVSQLESRLKRMRRGIAKGVNQGMSRQLGQRVKDSLEKAREMAEGPDRGLLLRQLQDTEAALTELLHTVFPGEFEDVTPTHSSTDLLALDAKPTHTCTDLMAPEERETALTSPPSTSLPLHPSIPLAAPPSLPPLSSPPNSSTILPSLRPSLPPTTSPLPPQSPDRVRLFLVIMDYDSHSLCTTGSPEQELTLPTGAVIAVHGSMQEDGYYRATFEGVRGKVPANFVQELDVQDAETQLRLTNQTLSRPLTSASSLTTVLAPASDESLPPPSPSSPLLPSPPSSFHVDQVLGQSVLLVSWEAPQLDALGCSNGCHVAGYRLMVGTETKSTVSGAAQEKAILAGLTLSRQLQLSICTEGSDGRVSPLVTIDYQGLPPKDQTPEPEPRHRMCVALYDYNPTECSPNENPEFELVLREGMLVKILGQELTDGFLVGEVDGRRGLVPAAFISEVEEGSDEKGSRPPSELVLPGTHKRMVARYDYIPSEHSPNENTEMELTFKAGDHITIYGNMGDDGFYSGELEGRFGLVPSNFLEEVEDSDAAAASPSPPPPFTLTPSPLTLTPPPLTPTPPPLTPTPPQPSQLDTPVGGLQPPSLRSENGGPWSLHSSSKELGADSSPSHQLPATHSKTQRRGFTFVGSRDWVKNTFSRKRNSSVL